MSMKFKYAAGISAAAFALSANLAAAQTVSEATGDDIERLDLDQVVTTSTPLARTLGKTITNVTVLDGEELEERLASSIGETLRLEPGISSTSFGAGASRPIIRGLGSDRIRVLADGIGTFAVDQTSPDHAVPVEPALAERIEVFRGAASLLYGSSAAGGIVNTITGIIPEEAPENGLEGAARYSYSTVDNGNEVAGGANVQLGQVVFHAEGSFREAGDYDIPGLVASNELIGALAAEANANGEPFVPTEEFETGFLPNSDLETTTGAFGASWLFDSGDYEGFFGASVSYLETNYGVPAGILTEEDLEGEEEGEEGEEGEEEGEEEGIRIDLDQIRYDAKGEIRGNLGLFEKARFRFGYGDYQHFELEGDEVGTEFNNEEYEGRLELTGKTVSIGNGEFRSATGIQFRNREIEAIGAEAFVPPSEQRQIAVFGLGEYSTGPWVFDGSLRYENVENETDSFIDEEDGPEMSLDNNFDLFSVSAGIGLQATEQLFLGFNGFRTERAPSVEENFSFGPHLATQFFEIGNPNFEEETARGFEATARGEFGPVTVIVNGFLTEYDNFIFEQETGEIMDGLPVFAFVGSDTRFRGFEAELEADLGSFNSGTIGEIRFSGQAQADFVKADTDGVLAGDQPRIPPFSTLVGLTADNDFATLRAEVEYNAAQNAVADFELPTGSFTIFNMALAVRPFRDRPNVTLGIRGQNLFDAEVRNAVSFLKDTAPLPGRNVRFDIKVAF
ncbi:MAG: TonB-dependent receptor [Pseudomonadota bacterium]